VYFSLLINRISLCFVIAAASACDQTTNFSQNINAEPKTECIATFLSPSAASEGDHSVAVAGEIEVNMTKKTLRVGDVVHNFSYCHSDILDICISASSPLAVASEPGEDVITINGNAFSINSNLSQHETSRKIVATEMKSNEISITTIYSKRDGIFAIYDDWGEMYLVEGRLDRKTLMRCSEES